MLDDGPYPDSLDSKQFDIFKPSNQGLPTIVIGVVMLLISVASIWLFIHQTRLNAEVVERENQPTQGERE